MDLFLWRSFTEMYHALRMTIGRKVLFYTISWAVSVHYRVVDDVSLTRYDTKKLLGQASPTYRDYSHWARAKAKLIIKLSFTGISLQK